MDLFTTNVSIKIEQKDWNDDAQTQRKLEEGEEGGQTRLYPTRVPDIGELLSTHK